MKDPIAIVDSANEPTADLARSILAEHAALQECERGLDAAERKAFGFRMQARRHREKLGRMLIEAKAAIKHGGWLPYLEKLGIPHSTAKDWMTEAGDPAAVKKPAKRNAGHSKSDPPTRDPDDAPNDPPSAPTLDLDRELIGISKKVMAFALAWPRPERSALAQQLRSMAEQIEDMRDA